MGFFNAKLQYPRGIWTGLAQRQTDVATFQQCLFIKIRCRKQTTVSNIELILNKHRVVNDLVLFRHLIGAGP